MKIEAGTKLGPYEILAPVGAGGMGEVYRARDTRLDRQVAIKVLPESMSRDKERLLRFEREAKLLASLNHSNVGAIYGFEEAEGKKFLVLEYVEGETLASRLKRGALPVDEALAVARQIAAGVEAAHEKGVIHRDLKPGNVMITPDGAVKVLDFGLARAMLDESSSSGPVAADSPTVTVQSPAITGQYTRPGVILGTAAYMGPEQARGTPVDKRSDIWSFGVVLYECLTGANPFAGETATDSMGAILHKEPDWSRLPPDTPPTIQLLLRRCLSKDRAKRLHDIADARIEIHDVLSGGLEGGDLFGSPPPSGVSPRAFAATLAAAVVLAVTTLSLAWLATHRESVPRTTNVHLSVVRDSADRIAPYAYLFGPAVAISPDGTRLAFLGSEHGQTKLFVRELDEVESRPLAGTEGAVAPFFSPDGRQIGFMSRGRLKTVGLDGNPPRDVCPAPGLRGACWTEQGEIIFSASLDSALSRVPAAGGVAEPLTRLNREEREVNHRFPEALPGGRFVLFLIRRAASYSSESIDYAVGLVEVGTGEHRILAEGLGHVRYADGLLISSWLDGSLAAAPFDLNGLRMAGSPTTVLAGVATSPLSGTSNFAVARTGTLVYLPGDAGAAPAQVVWLDRDGNLTPALPTKRRFTIPRLSHDGRYLTMGIGDPTPDIWRYDLRQNPPTRLRLTRDGVSILSTWSPDDRWICHGSGRTGTLQLYRMAADGSGEPQRIQASQHAQVPHAWSPDGKLLAYMEHRPETGFDIWIKPMNDDTEPWPVVKGPSEEIEPTFSPDSKWIAYNSTESGAAEIYVTAVSGDGPRYPVSIGGGVNCVWRGDEIIYRRGEELWAVKVTTEPEFSTQSAVRIFSGLSNTLIPARMFDVDHAGERIIVTLPDEQSQPPYHEIRVVTGWVENVKQRLVDESQ